MTHEIYMAGLLAQGDGNGAEAAAAGGGLIVMLLYLAVIVLVIASLWKIFDKAGKPGWAAIVPFYNMWVLVEICGKSALWFVLLFIPCVGIIVSLLLNIELAKVFGKGPGFGIGIILLPFIFLPMLAFGDATYQGPSASV